MPHARRSCVLALPEALRRNALAEGDAGRRWVSDLEVIVAEVTTALELQVNSAFARSSESLVLEVLQSNGNRAVLKLGRPGVDLRRETEVCRMANGRILPKVLAHHPEFNALLLEALGRPISALGWSVDAQMRAICRTLEALWQTPTNGTGLVKGSGRAHGMRKLIDVRSRGLDAPSDVATRNRAFDYAAERADAHRDDASVFVHGDAHANNTLTLLAGSEAPDAECKLIDPKGYYAEPACDLALIMRAFTPALVDDPVRLGRERCAWLAERTGANERAIWQWGFLARVVSGLLLKHRSRGRVVPPMLGVAHAWAMEPPPP